MATENGTTTSGVQDPATFGDSKGKGKAAAATEDDTMKDVSMGEDEDDEDEEEDADEETEAADEEDGLEEIDLDNVIGRRTRGKVIDFAKAAEENPPNSTTATTAFSVDCPLVPA
ncbi:histone chaperone domain CHZ-domain-containing protein [Lasiosphaeria miniovina]|uniref:Histone chaperone domain CHZ-domain-containing protein n=1 Tax=Lasiosphaeria miniovina TaxID=1954250 RepID=A0AA40A047_9PEZI|nr:histone chaperone domain CHZ-domain-containing protein [Lasiosphaeria miniovina]KAK0706810.1 histone chaperone domain CHZ-domain-containing protein [Lasiosphaeria miniovina]